MSWFEAIVKHYEGELMKVETDRVIVYAKNYAGAAAAIVDDYKTDLHSFMIGEAFEGDWHTYTCNRKPEERFSFLGDWCTQDILQ